MTDTTTETPGARVIAELARQAVDPTVRVFTADDGREMVILRDASGGEHLQPTATGAFATTRPGRIAQALTIETEESLIDYLRRYRDKASLLLASIDGNRIVAVLDYHEQGDAEGEAGTANFGEHVATLDLPFSLEWKAWTGIDGRLQPQLDFVRFLEENREDIISPAAADVLEACRDLQALRRVNFSSVVREDSDNYRIAYENETDTRSKAGEVMLPTEFVLSIPVYFGGPEIEVIALLRWKLSDEGALTLGVKLKRAERIRQAEFRQVVTRISEATTVPAVYGRRGG
jgi:uncharacterized protein YfdQ (DUF2303 family)